MTFKVTAETFLIRHDKITSHISMNSLNDENKTEFQTVEELMMAPEPKFSDVMRCVFKIFLKKDKSWNKSLRSGTI